MSNFIKIGRRKIASDTKLWVEDDTSTCVCLDVNGFYFLLFYDENCYRNLPFVCDINLLESKKGMSNYTIKTNYMRNVICDYMN